jgi:ElaB/YqjD/DUF883 family membrane-anchored ribosome-binding protein
MKNNKSATHHTPKEIINEMQGLVAEATTMMKDSVTEHSAEAIDNLRNRFGAAQERFTDLYQGARKRVVKGAKQADATIRENPYQSIAVAAGVGLIVGLIVGRRSR